MTIFKPLTQKEYIHLADTMLRQIKMLCPRFSLPSDDEDRAELVRLWAETLRSGPVYPRTVYRRAIEVYARTASRKDDPPMPGDILRSCIVAAEEIERDPVEGPRLRQWRDERRGIKS